MTWPEPTVWKALAIWGTVGVVGLTWRWAYDWKVQEQARHAQTSETALVDFDRRCTAVGGVALLNIYRQPMCLRGRSEMVVPEHVGEEGWSR